MLAPGQGAGDGSTAQYCATAARFARPDGAKLRKIFWRRIRARERLLGQVMEETKVDHVLLGDLAACRRFNWTDYWLARLDRGYRVFKTNGALSRRKQGFESPRERQEYININITLPWTAFWEESLT